ncbi:MAG: hypothetical protein ACJ78D_06235, partial [Gemmatimonadaceae bacterium]
METSFKRSSYLLVVPLLALSVGAGSLGAQAHSLADVLSGRVTDLAGKPVGDAQVITTAIASGLTRS